MQKTIFRPAAAALAVAACMAWGAAANAEPTGSTQADATRATATQASSHHHHAKRGGPRFAQRHGQQARHRFKRRAHRNMRAANVLFVPGYGGVSQAVVDQLELSDSQQKLLKQAQESTEKVRLTWSRKSQKSIGTIDPRSTLEDRKQHKEELAKARNERTENWLELWDSLDDTQQAFLSGVFAERSDRRVTKRGTNRSKITQEDCYGRHSQTIQGRHHWQSRGQPRQQAQ